MYLPQRGMYYYDSPFDDFTREKQRHRLGAAQERSGVERTLDKIENSQTIDRFSRDLPTPDPTMGGG